MLIKQSQAFTLIEMIIVIVLIGILSAIAAPKFMDIKDDAIKAVELNIYQAFLQGRENATMMATISGAKGGMLDLNKDGENDLEFKPGTLLINGARYCNGAECSFLTFESNLWSLNNKKVCYGILEQFVGNKLKVGIIDAGMTINQCVTQGYDLCVTSATQDDIIECQYAFAQSYNESDATVDWLIYTIDGPTGNQLIGLAALGFSDPETPWHTLADTLGKPGYNALRSLQMAEQSSDPYLINYYTSEANNKFQKYKFIKMNP
jgi:prepilin-type N-terminal cleavage/methylation domain-containing protein